MDTEWVEKRLDGCLLGSEELDVSAGNPFPEREGATLRLPAEY